jgi:hypothetical protein
MVPILKPCATFRSMLHFYCKELLVPCPMPKLKDHPLLAVCNCLLNIFAVTLHIWKASPPSTAWNAPYCGDKGHTHTHARTHVCTHAHTHTICYGTEYADYALKIYTHNVTTGTKLGIDLQMLLHWISSESFDCIAQFIAIIWLQKCIFIAHLAAIHCFFPKFVWFTYNSGSRPLLLSFNKVWFTI